jgi:hypothetical protein
MGVKMVHENTIVIGGVIKRILSGDGESSFTIWCHFEDEEERNRDYVPLNIKAEGVLSQVVKEQAKLEGTVKVIGALRRDAEKRIYVRAVILLFGEGRIS